MGNLCAKWHRESILVPNHPPFSINNKPIQAAITAYTLLEAAALLAALMVLHRLSQAHPQRAQKAAIKMQTRITIPSVRKGRA